MPIIKIVENKLKLKQKYYTTLNDKTLSNAPFI